MRALRLPAKRIVSPINAPALGGLTFSPSYEVKLTVLHSSGNPAEHFTLDNLPVADLSLNALGFDLLIGREVLALCRLDYDGRAGQFALTY